MKISVIIPTLNEEEAIEKVLSEFPEEFIDEIIVVDSSTDATAQIAGRLGAKIVFEHRRGYGRALQTGVENAKGDVVVYIDGDYTYDPKDIMLIVDLILKGKYDVVTGNRLNGKMHPGAMDLLNRFGNTLLSLIFSIIFLRRIDDTQCGLRAIRKQFLERVFCDDYGMTYVTEQLIKIIKKGARIGNVPITYRPRVGKTKLCAWTDGFKILKTILSQRFQNECEK